MSAQRTANQRLWLRPDVVSHYDGRRDLRPVEATILLRHRDELVGNVVELGCGTGRVTGYLAEIAGAVRALDISEPMLEAVRSRYPSVETDLRDLRDLGDLADGSFDAAVATYNIPDILDDEERNALLAELHRLLRPGGLLVMSTHNRGAAAHVTDPLKIQLRDPRRLASTLVHLRTWRRNRRRLLPHERHERDYSILNDEAIDFAGLHYYIDREAQERQLADHGFELIECLDLDARPVPAGDTAPHCTELHYVARASST